MAAPNPATIVHNLDTLGSILQTVSIITGLGLFMGGIFTMKRYGETRTFMSYHMTLAAPLMMMLAGVLLLVLPTSIDSALFAFWSTATPLHYGGNTEGWDQYIPAVVIFVRLIGVGAMMRGFVMLSRTGGGHGAQPGTLGRAMVHIFGGLLCVHILGTVNLLMSLFDLTTT